MMGQSDTGKSPGNIQFPAKSGFTLRYNRHVRVRKKEVFMKKIIRTLFVMILISTLVSCIAVGSGGKKIEQQPTLGQELLDLKKARDEGAISDQEYNEMKAKLKKSDKNEKLE
jgi:hypothetical protein